MLGTSLGFVLIASFLHAFWNTLAKKSPRKITFVWWFILFAVVLHFPCFF